jgi:hypothetical protein
MPPYGPARGVNSQRLFGGSIPRACFPARRRPERDAEDGAARQRRADRSRAKATTRNAALELAPAVALACCTPAFPPEHRDARFSARLGTQEKRNRRRASNGSSIRVRAERFSAQRAR